MQLQKLRRLSQRANKFAGRLGRYGRVEVSHCIAVTITERGSDGRLYESHNVITFAEFRQAHKGTLDGVVDQIHMQLDRAVPREASLVHYKEDARALKGRTAETVEELLDLIRKYVGAGLVDDNTVLALLAQYDAKDVQGLAKEEYQNYIADLEQISTYGTKSKTSTQPALRSEPGDIA